MLNLAGNWKFAPWRLKLPFYILCIMNVCVCALLVIGYDPTQLQPDAPSRLEIAILVTQILLITFMMPLGFLLNLIGWYHRKKTIEGNKE